jgi:hypothetical protein
VAGHLGRVGKRRDWSLARRGALDLRDDLGLAGDVQSTGKAVSDFIFFSQKKKS